MDEKNRAAASDAQVTCLTVGPLATRCYILHAEGAQACAVIDPGAAPKRIREAAGGRRIAAILLTHGHFDHIGAVRGLMEDGTRLLIHEADAPFLNDPVLNASDVLVPGMEVTAPAATELFHDGDEIDVPEAGVRFRVLHTPGHTPGSSCFTTGSLLFTGDTLFRSGCGRTDLPGGDPAAILRSVRTLLRYIREHDLHGIYPGHEGI